MYKSRKYEQEAEEEKKHDLAEIARETGLKCCKLFSHGFGQCRAPLARRHQNMLLLASAEL